MILELKKICEDAEAFRNQVWLDIELSNGERISIKVKDNAKRTALMHACRRGGLNASYKTPSDFILNKDKETRKEPFWGTEKESIFK